MKVALGLFAASSLALAGCGGGTSGPATQPVSGVIKYKGAPVAGAAVTFVPQAQGAGGGQRPAFGQTDEAGQYTLTTVQPGDGAIVGTYRVTVTKTEKPPATASPGADESSADYVPPPDNPRPTPPPKNLLPRKYATAEGSELLAEVKEEDNTFDFELKD
jgi:hypothetical protein